METVDRPNSAMAALVNEAISIAAATSRPCAAEFLYTRGCSLDVIARVLAKNPDRTRTRSIPDAASAGTDIGLAAPHCETAPNRHHD